MIIGLQIKDIFEEHWDLYKAFIDDHMELYNNFDVLTNCDFQLGLHSALDGGYAITTEANPTPTSCRLYYG
jgi:hypothetical protein